MISVNHDESTGRLASGLIHYLNNSLGVLFGYLEMALEDCSHDPDLTDQLHCVEKAADRVRDVVNRFHFICSKGDGRVAVFDLVHVSRNLLESLELLFPKAIEILVEWPLMPLLVTGRASLWQQAFLNILLNARDAMPEGGILRIHFSRIIKETEMSFARIEVSDQCQGQTAEERLNPTPFSSETHPAARSLPSVLRIVTDMGGQMAIENAKSEAAGSRIVITIPLSN